MTELALPARREPRRTWLARALPLVALVNLGLLVLFLQVSAVRTPTSLSSPVEVAPGVHAVAYDLADDTLGPDQRLDLTFYLDGDPHRVRRVGLTLVPTAEVQSADPVRVLDRGDVVERSSRRLHVRLAPKVGEGTYKLRLGSGRPFGLVHVGS